MSFESQWIVIEESRTTKSGATKIWEVASKQGTILGEIRWYSAWRRYCFAPCIDTIFDANCLKDIYGFVVEAMAKHKADKFGMMDCVSGE